MKLSEVPFHELQCKENWLTSLTGKAGTITAITTTPHGNEFRTFLEIDWREGKNSVVLFPDECTNIQAALHRRRTSVPDSERSTSVEPQAPRGTLYGVLQL